jgi:hypothetical protein
VPYAALTLPNLPAGWELQLFAQVEAAFSNYDERGPGPIDQDDFDVIQAFAKISVPLWRFEPRTSCCCAVHAPGAAVNAPLGCCTTPPDDEAAVLVVFGEPEWLGL